MYAGSLDLLPGVAASAAPSIPPSAGDSKEHSEAAAIVTELRCVDMSEPVQRDEQQMDAHGNSLLLRPTFPMVSLYEANLLLRKL